MSIQHSPIQRIIRRRTKPPNSIDTYMQKQNHTLQAQDLETTTIKT